MRLSGRHLALVTVLGLVAAWPAAAREGDKPGWSFTVDQRRHSLLFFAKDERRVLSFACLRSAESFEILVEDVGNVKTAVTGVPLTLRNGSAIFEAKGEIGFFASTKSFDSNMIVNTAALMRIRDTLMPVLEGPGPIVLTLSSLTREVPVAGIADPLKRFKAGCFSGPEAEEPVPEKPQRRRKHRR
jgi:hypothetical protein